MKEFKQDTPKSGAPGTGAQAKGFSAQTSYPVQRKDDPLNHIKATASQVFKHDVNDVEIQLNSSAPKQMKALATAQDKLVKIAPSHSDLSKPENVKVVGHELKHTVQQAKGLVKPTGTIGGVKVNTEKRHEADADRGGEALAQAL